MHDSIAAWMMAGGLRSERADRDLAHLVAIREARAETEAAKPGFLDWLRARVPTTNPTPTVDCCVA